MNIYAEGFLHGPISSVVLDPDSKAVCLSGSSCFFQILGLAHVHVSVVERLKVTTWAQSPDFRQTAMSSARLKCCTH